MKTMWKLIPGFGSKYQVNEHGDVQNIITGRVLKKIVRRDGYLCVNLSDKNKAKSVMVHRLVAEAFLENSRNLPIVNHIDGNKSNPNIQNLEWVTASENNLHAYRIGLSSISDKCKKAVSKIAAQNGSQSTSARVAQINNNENIVAIFNSIREAERITGIKRCNISRSCKSNYLKAGGYRWKKI